MKNIWWLGCLILLFVSCSKDSTDDEQQNTTVFDLIYNGEVIPDNSQVQITTVSTENGYNEMLFPLLVRNNTNKDIQIRVEKKQLEAADEGDNDFCWGGKCYPSATNKTDKASTIESGKTDDSFHASYRPKKAGNTKMKYIFTENGGEIRSVEVDFKYNLN